MVVIRECKCSPQYYPRINQIQADNFRDLNDFEAWLRRYYIPKTYAINWWTDPKTSLPIDLCKTECWGIFSQDRTFIGCCQTYPETTLTPEFENMLRGKIFSHNHPSGETLSIYDIFIWINLKILEFRVVTDIYKFIVKPINGSWPNADELLDRIKEICPSIIPSASRYPTGRLRHECFQQLRTEEFFEYSIE